LSELTVRDIATICGLIDRTQAPEKAAMALGATADDIMVLERAAKEFALRAGRSMWRVASQASVDESVSVLRRLRSMEGLETLWEAIDADPHSATAQAILAVTNACFAYLKPVDGKDLMLPADEARMLKRLLESLNLRCLPVDALPSRTLDIIRVERPGERAAPRFAGWALKRALGVVFLWTRHRAARLADRS
jgi:hypothetical protein